MSETLLNRQVAGKVESVVRVFTASKDCNILSKIEEAAVDVVAACRTPQTCHTSQTMLRPEAMHSSVAWTWYSLHVGVESDKTDPAPFPHLRTFSNFDTQCSEVPAPRNPRSGSCRPERAPRWQPAAQASPHEVCAVPRGLCHPTEARWPLQLLQLLQRLHLPRLLRL